MSENWEIVIDTDQNIDYLKQTYYLSTLLNIILHNYLVPTIIIIRPTGVTTTSATLIDNIIISVALTKSYKNGLFCARFAISGSNMLEQ